MKTIAEIRRDNLGVLIKEHGLNNLAEKLGKGPSQVSQWKNASKDSKTGKPRGMRDDTCRGIEEKLKKPKGWMDKDHTAAMAHDIFFVDKDPENSTDEFTKQLLYFFKGMSLEHKDALLLLANKLHAIDNRNDPRSNPYPVPPRGKKTVKS